MKDKSNPLTIKNGVVIECRKNTTEVVIPEGVTAIGREAFLGCESLKSVEIPKSVRRIGSSVFLGCNALVEVRYGGTKAQWACITGLYQNKELLYAPVLCKDGTVRLEERTDGFLAVGSIACGHRDTGAVALKIPADITAIGSRAFVGCTALKSVTIPGTVKRIGEFAFGGCTALKSVIIPGTVKRIGECAFRGCTSLENISIPKGVTEIGKYAFQKCTSLKTLVIPDGVTGIGGWAFRRCTALKSVTIPGTVKRIGEFAFRGCTSLAELRYGGSRAQWESVTKIGSWHRDTPAHCVKCADGDVPLPLYIVKDGVLKDWLRTSAEAVIPKGVTKIGDHAFISCTSLEGVVIPDGVREIGDSAFFNCTSLKSVVIPDSVREIGELAFADCKSLSEIRFDGTVAQWESVTKIGNWHRDTPAHCVKCADGDVPLPLYIVKDGVLENWLRTSAEAVIPKGVTKIGKYAFAGCMSLESVVIPDGVTKIDVGAFGWCTSLKSVRIPSGVKIIDAKAFAECASLESVTIPDGVTEIGELAFAYCKSLSEIRFDGTVAQWEAVEKGKDWNRDIPAKVVHCADGNVPL